MISNSKKTENLELLKNCFSILQRQFKGIVSQDYVGLQVVRYHLDLNDLQLTIEKLSDPNICKSCQCHL